MAASATRGGVAEEKGFGIGDGIPGAGGKRGLSAVAPAYPPQSGRAIPTRHARQRSLRFLAGEEVRQSIHQAEYFRPLLIGQAFQPHRPGAVAIDGGEAR